MADFFQGNQQDPEALRKALLAKLFGGTPPPVAPGAAAASPTTPTVAPPSPAAQPLSTPLGPQPAKPLSAAPTPTVADPGNQPPPIMSETDWAKQNPQPAHTPYTPPDLKHRLLTGLFAGMQEFGRPGEGARTVANYTSDIEKKTEEEKNYPTTSADATRKRYMDYVAGERAPIDLQDLQSQIAERQAHARDLDAQAKLRANPVQKPENLAQMHADALGDALKRGVKPSEDPHVLAVEDAIQRVQKENKPTEPKYTYQKIIGADGKPHVWQIKEGTNEKQDMGVAPNETHGDKTNDQVERETRQSVRKAQEQYRGAQATADMQREFIREAKGGNKAAVKIVPLEGALEITTSQGVHRINQTEVAQYGGAGTIFDKIHGALQGKLWNGQDIPDNILNQMDAMTQEVERNAYQRYSDTYDDEMGIAGGYGVDLNKKLPKLQRGGRHSQDAGGGAAAPGALPPGWK